MSSEYVARSVLSIFQICLSVVLTAGCSSFPLDSKSSKGLSEDFVLYCFGLDLHQQIGAALKLDIKNSDKAVIGIKECVLKLEMLNNHSPYHAQLIQQGKKALECFDQSKNLADNKSNETQQFEALSKQGDARRYYRESFLTLDQLASTIKNECRQQSPADVSTREVEFFVRASCLVEKSRNLSGAVSEVLTKSVLTDSKRKAEVERLCGEVENELTAFKSEYAQDARLSGSIPGLESVVKKKVTVYRETVQALAAARKMPAHTARIQRSSAESGTDLQKLEQLREEILTQLPPG